MFGLTQQMKSNEDKVDRGGMTITLSSRGVVVLAAAVIIAGLAMAFALMKLERTTARAVPAGLLKKDPDHASANRATRESSPWGELVIYNVEVEKPDEYLSPNIDTNQPTRWFFGPVTPQQLAMYLEKGGIPPAEVQRLTTAPVCQQSSNGLWVSPGSAYVLGLSPETRRYIYTALSEFPANFYQHFPFSFRKDAFGQWFEHSKMEDATVSLVKKLVYDRGASICFSDLNEVLVQIPDFQERKRLLKTLSRQATVMMKLRIRPDTDVDKLLQYWGKGARMKDARPLIESLTTLPDGATLDVVHLMPPFARRRLYTYPFPPTRPSEGGEDCHWTSMNFFGDTPDDRFLNKEHCRSVLQNDYYVVSGPLTYGDVLVFLNDQGTAIHSAVYIADGIVFTKNGSSHLQPWTLMKLEDLVATYPTERSLSLSSFRQKRW